jgi:UDP-MurNAc hydroxylase
MKITYFASSTVLVEAGGIKILMDPWLEDGEYYGSWAHFPPIDVDYEAFSDVDFIYISHIHPDHMSKATLAKLDKSIPILIHRYQAKFLKLNLERAGFQVVELPHGEARHLSPDAIITIYAADDCDPEQCGAHFNCTPMVGSTQVDSLCVVEGDGQVLVNTNDCPFGLARKVLPRLKARFPKVDMLLVGYSGAGPYPQCFSMLSASDKQTAGDAKKAQFLRQGLNFIMELQPKLVLPFAGQYTLAGDLSSLNDLRGIPELAEARDYFRNNLHGQNTAVVLLDRGGSIDLSNLKIERPYVEPPPGERERYTNEVLAERRFAFQDDPQPDADELITLAQAAGERVEAKRLELGFESSTKAYVRLAESVFARVSFDGQPLEIVDQLTSDAGPYVSMTVDPRLLKRILSGPQFGHWNNATIGSHVTFARYPNHYETDLYAVMNYFHA